MSESIEPKWTVRTLIGFLLTVRQHNEREWMELAAQYANEVAEQLDEPDRFRFDGDGLRRIEP